MDVLALTDAFVAVAVIVGCLWALVALLVLGLGRAASDGDDAMEAYIAQEMARVYGPEDPYDARARQWIAEQRRAS